MFGIRKNKRGVAAISLTTTISVLLITAVLGGIGAGLALLAGLTAIGYSVAFSAIVAGIVEGVTLYQNPAIGAAGTITIRTLLVLVGGAVLAALEYASAHPALTVPTVIAAVAVAVTYIQQNIVAGLKLRAARKAAAQHQ
jgi:hypothetical protein